MRVQLTRLHFSKVRWVTGAALGLLPTPVGISSPACGTVCVTRCADIEISYFSAAAPFKASSQPSMSEQRLGSYCLHCEFLRRCGPWRSEMASSLGGH